MINFIKKIDFKHWSTWIAIIAFLGHVLKYFTPDNIDKMIDDIIQYLTDIAVALTAKNAIKTKQ